MKTVVGVFKSRSDAERGAAELAPLEISKHKINVLTPEVTDKEIAAVPTVAGEQPGMGAAMGAVVGGAIGVAGGAGLAPAVASFLVPGVGPVLGIGVLAGTLLGAFGAAGGATVAAALENEMFQGLPEGELFVYEDALRKGRSVVVVMTEDDEVDAVRGALKLGGALVKVSVADVRVEHEVKLMDFTKWLEKNGGSPGEVSARQRIRSILGMPISRQAP